MYRPIIAEKAAVYEERKGLEGCGAATALRAWPHRVPATQSRSDFTLKNSKILQKGVSQAEKVCYNNDSQLNSPVGGNLVKEKLMKRLFFFLLVLGVSVSLFAQVQLPEYHFAAGSWGFLGDRVYQNNARSGLAKANIRVPQQGPMIYEFNARYEDGLQDGHGGFGFHVFADSAYNGPSWGVGKSYLLWLNYDEKPITPGIPRGFSAQVYRSINNSRMELVQSFDLNEYLPYITWDDIRNPVPLKIWVNGDTGEVRAYDPSDPSLSRYWYFYLSGAPLKGDWIALRTNGAKLSFGL
jgi:hypothetical protein